MKFAENNRISHRQLYRQIILSLAAPFLLCMSGKDWPYASGGLDDGNGLLGLVLALVVLGFYVVFLIRLEPYFGDLTKAAGGFLGRVIGAFFLVFVLLAGGYLLTVIADLVPVSLVTGISGNWIAFWAVLACGAGTCRGMQRRGRMAEVSGGFLLGGILLMMALCIPQGKAVYLEEMTETWNLSAGSVIEKMYGTLCAFSVIGLLPFALGDVEKYGSAGKAVTGGIVTAGGILAGMKILMPAVLGMDRVRAEEYPVLPLLDGADLPGNVLARFDVLWMGFLLYSLLFALGSLMHYGHQIIRRAHLGTGRVWMAAVMWLLSQISIGGLEIRQYFLWYLSYIFLPGLLICQVYVYLRCRGRYRKKTAALSLFLVFSLFLGSRDPHLYGSVRSGIISHIFLSLFENHVYIYNSFFADFYSLRGYFYVVDRRFGKVFQDFLVTQVMAAIAEIILAWYNNLHRFLLSVLFHHMKPSHMNQYFFIHLSAPNISQYQSSSSFPHHREVWNWQIP